MQAVEIFHGHGLRTAGLNVDFDPAQTRQQIGYFAGDDMTAIEFGSNLHR